MENCLIKLKAHLGMLLIVSFLNFCLNLVSAGDAGGEQIAPDEVNLKTIEIQLQRNIYILGSITNQNSHFKPHKLENNEKVVVGSDIHLAIEIIAPAGVTVANTKYQWEIQGPIIKDYTYGRTDANGELVTKDAKVVQMAPEDLKKPEVIFYWYGKSETKTVNVTVTADFNGVTKTIKKVGTLDLEAPQFTSMKSTSVGKVTFLIENVINGVNQWRLGPGERKNGRVVVEGFAWTSEAIRPNNFSGFVRHTQLVQVDFKIESVAADGTVTTDKTINTGADFYLDSTILFGNEERMGNNGTAVNDRDQPGGSFSQPTVAGETRQMHLVHNFKTYFLYKPSNLPGSKVKHGGQRPIYVPLAQMKWGYQGDAKVDAAGKGQPSGIKEITEPTSGVEDRESFPEWEKVLDSAP